MSVKVDKLLEKYNNPPIWSIWMYAILDALKNLGGSARPKEVREWIIKDYEISPEELENVYEKTGTPIFNNQVAFAREYLKRAEYLDGSIRGVWTLSPKGIKSDLSIEEAIKLFNQTSREYQQNRRENLQEENQESIEESEVIETSDEGIIEKETNEASDIKVQIKQSILKMSPKGFEYFCKKLLYTYGFDEVNVTGGSGDGGIDGKGILKLNAFIKIPVIFQCKRYKGTVPASHVRDFGYNVLKHNSEMKGIFLTSGYFSNQTSDEFENSQITLVDGDELVNLIIDSKLGIKTVEILNQDFYNEYVTM